MGAQQEIKYPYAYDSFGIAKFCYFPIDGKCHSEAVSLDFIHDFFGSGVKFMKESLSWKKTLKQFSKKKASSKVNAKGTRPALIPVSKNAVLKHALDEKVKRCSGVRKVEQYCIPLEQGP